MKNKTTTLLCALLACHPLLGATRTTEPIPTSPTPKIDVQIESNLKILADGFVAAFSEIPAGARWIWIRSGNETRVLSSVRSIRAYGGVLAIQIESGPVHLVSAGDVIQITNENPRPMKK